MGWACHPAPTPQCHRQDPRSTQHGVPSAQPPGPKAHGSFHGWKSRRWERALPRGHRASRPHVVGTRDLPAP